MGGGAHLKVVCKTYTALAMCLFFLYDDSKTQRYVFFDHENVCLLF